MAVQISAVLHVHFSILFLANHKPAWALVNEDLQTSTYYTASADLSNYKIECQAECIWIGYNPHQIVSRAKVIRNGKTLVGLYLN